MNIPINNNVYGQFYCDHSLDSVAQGLRNYFGYEDHQVYITKSNFGGTQTLSISTNEIDFESIKTDESNHYLFSGAIGGDIENVVAFTERLSHIMNKLCIKAMFEVYNENSDFIREFGA